MRWLIGVVMVAAGLGGALASELHLEGEPVQGGLVRGQTVPGSAVWLDGRRLRLSADGWFAFGFGRDATGSVELRVRDPDGREERRQLEITARSYEIERIDGLPPAKVTPRTEAEIARIEADARLIGAAKRRDSDLRGFIEQAVWPVRGRVSGIYGSQRVLNGKPRSPHRGVDVAAPEGTPVRAIASGVVSLAARGMYFTGGTVMIDHGHGLESIYAHLSEVRVAVGQRLAQGAVIGTVGATGRATGPHLHWGVYWFERALDPALLVGAMPPP